MWSFFVEVHEKVREVRSVKHRPLVCGLSKLGLLRPLISAAHFVGANFVRKRGATSFAASLTWRAIAAECLRTPNSSPMVISTGCSLSGVLCNPFFAIRRPLV